MQNNTGGSRPFVIAGLIVGLALVLGAGAAPEAGLKVAVVDSQKLLNGYKGTQASNKALQTLFDGYQARISVYKSNPLLEEPDQKRLGELAIKETAPGGLTAPEVAEKKKFTDKSAALAQEFTTLQTKNANAVTPADRDRLTQLTKLGTDTDNRLSFLAKEADDELNKQRSESMVRVSKEIRDGIAKVAKKEGFNLVFSNDTALYADNDITDNVLKAIN